MIVVLSILGFIGKFYLFGAIVAILFGIYMALFSKDENKDESDSSKQEPAKQEPELDNSPYIDLGLSIKWASCNLGASHPWDKGEYYAWGETESKSEYNTKTYKWYSKKHFWSNQKEISDVKIDKYSYEVISLIDDKYEGDEKVNLMIEDDAVAKQLGRPWRMPTEKEIVELVLLCEWTPMTIHGREGFLVVSRYNGNSIFLPATGIKHDTSISKEWNDGRIGGYLSKRLYPNTQALGISLYSNHMYGLDALDRIYGYSIRPVHP